MVHIYLPTYVFFVKETHCLSRTRNGTSLSGLRCFPKLLFMIAILRCITYIYLGSGSHISFKLKLEYVSFCLSFCDSIGVLEALKSQLKSDRKRCPFWRFLSYLVEEIRGHKGKKGSAESQEIPLFVLWWLCFFSWCGKKKHVRGHPRARRGCRATNWIWSVGCQWPRICLVDLLLSSAIFGCNHLTNSDLRGQLQIQFFTSTWG